MQPNRPGCPSHWRSTQVVSILVYPWISCHWHWQWASGIRRSWIFGHIPGIFHIYDHQVYMSGIFRYTPGIWQPISYTRYMSGICLRYSFRVVSSLCLEYSRYIPRIFFPSNLVICLEYTWIIPLLANRPAAAMQLGCCCHRTRTSIVGFKGV